MKYMFFTLVIAVAFPAQALAAFSVDHYVERVAYCTSYEQSPEYTAVVDGKSQVIGRNYKMKAYKIFPVTKTGATEDGMLIKRDRNVKQWEYFFRFLRRHVRCEDAYYPWRRW